MDAVILIVQFQNYLQNTSYSKTTIESYGYNMNHFKEFLANAHITDIREVTHEVIFSYQQNVLSSALSTESKAARIRPVKRFFEYLVKTHQFFINPTEG